MHQFACPGHCGRTQHYNEKVSDQWQRRWQNLNGDVVFSSNPSYDPNVDRMVRHTIGANLKRSGARQR